MTRPKFAVLAVAGLAVAAAFAVAQTPPTAEQYQDAMNQLKRLQDDKSALAAENQKLRDRVAELTKVATTQATRFTTLQGHADFLQEHYAAWRNFVDQNPSVRTMWAAYFSSLESIDIATALLGDGRWPFAVEG